MSDEPMNVTRLLKLMGEGDPRAADELLPAIYEELRRMARAQLGNEKSGVTLQPTALVHEAYLRLVGDGQFAWNSRGHFFSAAALAMRRILVERARHHQRLKRGGDWERVELSDEPFAHEPDTDTLLAIDELLQRLEAYDAVKARIVMLKLFADLTIEETAAALELSPSKVKEDWAYARAWMHRELKKGLDAGSTSP
jgi:RNA polymerase sigma factor (TIGR02999 family)